MNLRSRSGASPEDGGRQLDVLRSNECARSAKRVPDAGDSRSAIPSEQVFVQLDYSSSSLAHLLPSVFEGRTGRLEGG